MTCSVLPRVRIGFIGCGWWATFAHMPAVERHPQAEIAGLAEPDPTRRSAAAARFGVTATFATAEELLDDVEVDAVVVAVPHALHYPIARLALERGKHVLLEKPMVLDPAHGYALIALARERQRELVIGYPMHYNPQAIALREAIIGGRIGELEHVSCLYASVVRELFRGRPERYEELFEYPLHGPAVDTYHDAALSGGGQGQSQLSHAAGLLLFLTGLRPQAVAALCANFELDVDLADAVAVRFDSGAIGTLSSTGSLLAQHEEIVRYEIFGRDGHIVFDVNQGVADIFDAGGHTRLRVIEPSVRVPATAPVENLVQLVLGHGTNGSPAEIAVGAVELVAMMYASARESRLVSLADVGPARNAPA